jgi:mannose-6-phosphate isomerase class I
MTHKLPFLKLDPFLFTPLSRTPWAGTLVSSYKQNYFLQDKAKIPPRVGESWELSTDPAFLSQGRFTDSEPWQPLRDILKQAPEYLGKYKNDQGSCPLLLKWLSASEPLSVQLHPPLGHPGLKAGECGKPEAWLVVHAEPGSCVYLGFEEGFTNDEIKAYLQSDDPTPCLYRYQPRAFDYISVPPGCVHAVGPGLLLVEPQQVVGNLSTKTWRLFDWHRRYNSQGQPDPEGQLRELHVLDGLSAIDFGLPRGKDLEKAFIHCLQPTRGGSVFLGDIYNPFAVRVFSLDSSAGGEQSLHFKNSILVPDNFCALTLWEGSVCLRSKHQTLHVHGGETVLIAAFVGDFEVTFEEGAGSQMYSQAQGAFFSLS